MRATSVVCVESVGVELEKNTCVFTSCYALVTASRRYAKAKRLRLYAQTLAVSNSCCL
ncbi:hypothetical protein [Campylobacter troglodytis]|uniref:hypothetical protein n=1 Tax=Campylobacter troglodytis TaxID=654363 RepID=UPI00163BF2E2